MFVLYSISLFVFVPFIMLLMHLVRPKLNIQGFLAIIAVLAGWILVFMARADIPDTISLLQWEPGSLFPLSPSLLIDQFSWFLSLALVTLVLSVMIASIAQLGQSSHFIQAPDNGNPGENAPDKSNLIDQPAQPSEIPISHRGASWVLWASILSLTSLGLLAVSAGNFLTLLLAWAAIDLIELIILLGQVAQSRMRERIIMAFSARMAGICILLFAGVLLWSSGLSLTFDSISQSAYILLVLTAGLRLGVLPLHLPFIKGLPIDRNLGTVLRLVPTVSSYILLLRLSSVGITSTAILYMLGLTLFGGIYAAVKWFQAKDELDGRPYWLLGSSSLVVAAAILHQPFACLVWSIASLLSGGFIFSMFLRHKNLFPLVVIGIINLSALPFTPTWRGVSLYEFSPALGVSLPVFGLFSILLLVIQVFIFAGFTRHVLRGTIPLSQTFSKHTERWVWFLYPLGLAFLVVTHLVIGGMTLGNLQSIPLSRWIIGLVLMVLTGFTMYISWRNPHLVIPSFDPAIRSTWDRILSFDWVYRSLWRLFRSLTKMFSLFSAILEGDGGLLWALVIFGLIFVFLQR